jgi:hypothetical protein
MPTASAEFLLLCSFRNMNGPTIMVGTDGDPWSRRLADFHDRVEVFVFILVNQSIISKALTKDCPFQLWSEAG